uniref:ISAon1 family transposase n=1 Tax=Bacteroides xylanisolvens TaxID=371601 RepID=UPI001F04C0CF|nr:transposase [Bacteroides xylanisolvens]
MDGKQLQSQYKDHLSDFQNWDQRAHAQEYILYPKNMGYHLCIDETALSKGDLYTILINRDKRGRKGSIIAVIQGTKTDDIIAVLTKMPQELRNQVKEITLDMAGSMQKIAKTCFPRAMQVIDRFHVQKLVYEAVQELRITYRWQVIKEENKAFTLVNHVSQDTCFILYLEEKATIPAEYSDLHLHSKGFLPEIEVQDFPIRGKAVYLRIKRRRWEDPSTGQTYSRDWSLVGLSLKPWGIALKFLFLHHENILFPND